MGRSRKRANTQPPKDPSTERPKYPTTQVPKDPAKYPNTQATQSPEPPVKQGKFSTRGEGTEGLKTALEPDCWDFLGCLGTWVFGYLGTWACGSVGLSRGDSPVTAQ